MKTYIKFSLVFSIILPLLISCEDNKNKISGAVSSEDSIYVFVDDIMHSWYLWYDKVPDVNKFEYSNPNDLLEDLKYKVLDKWSYIDIAETVESYYEDGESFGFGFYPRFDEYGNLYVVIIYEDSEAYKQGIRKGDRITSIGGVDPRFYSFDSFIDDSPQTIQFTIENNGSIKDLTLSKTTIIQNGVFYSNTYSVGGKLVGYMVYDSFLGYTKTELEEAISFFKASEIDDLIIDLRYNGGGYVNIAKEFAEMLIPKEKVGEVFVSNIHNEIAGPLHDSTQYLEQHPLNLNLNRVFFITSEFSASASELLINCLDPHMEVFTIGSTTRGKPVGMYGFKFHEWLMFPVTVISVNADGYGEYYEGLGVDAQAGEGVDKPWGDVSDPNLNLVFSYIKNGSFGFEAYKIPKSSTFNDKLSLPERRNVMLFNR